MHIRTTFRCALGGFALLTALVLLAASAPAQDEPSPTDVPNTSDDRPRGGRFGRGGPESRPHERGPEHGFGGEMGLGMKGLLVAPEDRGPLKPGEQEELLQFMEQQMPHLYQAFERLRQRDPDRFAERLTQSAPRLRQMRTLFRYNPEIGDVFKAHAQNQFQIRRTAETLFREPPGSALREQAQKELRGLLVKSVQLETRVVELLAAEREASRDVRIEERVKYLLSPAVDLSAEPEWMRTMIAAYGAATDDTERADWRQKLTDAITRGVDTEIKALHERIDDMRANAAAEVDQRLEQILKAGPHGERRSHGRGPGGGPERRSSPPR